MLQTPHSLARADAPPYFALRAALLFCAPMLVNGIGLPYFPVFLHYLNMSDHEIGIILAMPHLVRMFGMPLGAWAADRAKDRATMVLFSACMSFATAIALFFTHTFWPVLIVFALQGFFYAPYVPIAESVLIAGVRRWGYEYGFLRMWGSVAFIFATIGGGFLFDLFGGAMVLPSMATFFFLTILMALATPRLGRVSVVRPENAGRYRFFDGPFWRLEFLLVIVGAALVQGSHGMLFAFASNYWKGLGFTGTEISLLWTAGVVAEICLFYVSARLLARFNDLTLVIIGCVAGVVRWCIFPHELGLWGHLALQCSHALTFAIIHVGIQRFMMTRVGEERGASAQSFYQIFVSLFTVMTSWASGYIFHAYGVIGFYSMALVAGVGALSVLTARLLYPQSARSGG